MQESVQAFLRVLDPKDNQTGGGAASAVAGAMSAALAGMVARVSIGKAGMESEDFYRQVDRRAQDLADRLFAGAHEDSQAFDAVMAAYRAPRDTPKQEADRSQAIQDAMTEATLIPLINGEGCVRALELCEQLAGRSNPNAASDLACARYLGRAALLGCLSNIQVNLASIKDKTSATELDTRYETLSKQAERWNNH